MLEAKLALTASVYVDTSSERQFSRVIALKGLPVPEYGSSVIDVSKLLKIRDSDECRAFKDLLSRSEAMSDNELRERLSGLGRRIRQAVNSRVGKAFKFVVSNGLGIVHPVAGVAFSAVDAFLIERLIPKDSVLSFLSESYPSLFKRP
jgi:hypothetical protein